ncbi:hypothetical protein U1Q18_048711 [Sarracenia purpurea var. burkii]
MRNPSCTNVRLSCSSWNWLPEPSCKTRAVPCCRWHLELRHGKMNRKRRPGESLKAAKEGINGRLLQKAEDTYGPGRNKRMQD